MKSRPNDSHVWGTLPGTVEGTPKQLDKGPSTVGPAELEELLATLTSRAESPGAGLFGPSSKLWQVNRHSALFLGSGRAGLLQLAHPWVAQAIADHSRTKADPYGRFQRTFRRVFAMVFGTLDEALASARSVHALHTTIHGRMKESVGQWQDASAYTANRIDALLWVHATLWETSITVYETFIGELSSEDKNAYYQETRLFAHLFGIPDSALPPDWEGFLAYNRDMWHSKTLAVGASGRDLGHFLFEPPDPMLAPLTRRFRDLTTGLLPPPLREAFGLPFGSREERSFETSKRLFRRLVPLLPRTLRYVAPYLAAERRLAGKPPGVWIGFLQQLYTGEATR